jgi:TPR repeat protein
VPYGQLARNADAAVAACEKAVAASPTQGRYQYQLGRSLQAKNPDLARQYFQTAARMNYPAAYDNLGNLAIQLDRDFQKATEFYRKGIALKDVDAMITMADLIIKRRVPGTPIEAAFLYYQAADNGHANAKRVVARVSGINYAELSRILVEEANR